MRDGVRRTLKIAALLLLPAAAQAGTLSIRVEPPDAIKAIRKTPSWNIVLEGDIDPEAPARLAATLRKAGPGGADVYISAPGGNLFAGMEIGRLLRRAGANTHVGSLVADTSAGALARSAGRKVVKARPGFCYSACSLAFLGGVRRDVPRGAAYGVHRFSNRSAGPKESDWRTSQVVSAAVTAYIREMGADPALFDLMLRKGKDGIRVLSEAELRRFAV